MKKRAYSDPGDRYDKALETEIDKSPCQEKARKPLDLDPASLPPCSPETIISGKPCILFKKPYQKIHFPRSKAPEKQPEEIPDGWEWGEWGEER